MDNLGVSLQPLSRTFHRSHYQLMVKCFFVLRHFHGFRMEISPSTLVGLEIIHNYSILGSGLNTFIVHHTCSLYYSDSICPFLLQAQVKTGNSPSPLIDVVLTLHHQDNKPYDTHKTINYQKSREKISQMLLNMDPCGKISATTKSIYAACRFPFWKWYKTKISNTDYE